MYYPRSICKTCAAVCIPETVSICTMNFQCRSARMNSPVLERLLAQVAALQFDEIECVDAIRRLPCVQQREENRLAVVACSPRSDRRSP